MASTTLNPDPEYRTRGAKAKLRNPTQFVAERGETGGALTRMWPDGQGQTATSLSLPAGVGHQAPTGNIATGVSTFAKHKQIFILECKNDTRDLRCLKNLHKCCRTESCNKPRCKACPFMSNERLSRSAITGKAFGCLQESCCQTKNVVYLLSCKKCGIQYVGETMQSLRERFNQHKNSVIRKSYSTLLVSHFNQAGHSINDMTIRVLEKLNENDARLSKTKLKAKLHEAEDFWIRLLVTAYPFGLNDKIKGYGLATDICDPTIQKSAPYFCMPIPRRKRGHGVKRRTCRQRNANLSNQLEELIQNTDKPAGIRSLIVFLHRQNHKTLAYCNQIVRDNSYSMPMNVRIIVLAFIAGYFSQRKPNEKSKDCYRLTVDFPNKGLEIIGFDNIFRNHNLRKIVTANKTNDVKPVSVVYKYEPPFSRKLCNYSVCLREIMDGKFEKYSNNCSCAKYPSYVYAPTGHVITGDVSIVEDKSLQQLFAKGAKYRLPKDVNWTEVENASSKAVFRYLLYLQRKKFINAEQALKYHDHFMQIVLSRIFRNSHMECNKVSTYHMPSITRELRNFHSKFVVTCADKCANNFVFVCKFWYFKILCDELGVCLENGRVTAVGNNTYKPVDENVAEIINRHCSIAKSFSVHVSKDDMKLPRMFAIPKLHKSPYGWRFIAGARQSSTKSTSKLLHTILSHFRCHFKNYCTSIKKTNGKSCFWSIDNSIVVKDRLMALQHSRKIKGLISADFSTLFTTLPHNMIKKCIFAIVDKCFDNSGKMYISVKTNKASYTDCYEEDTGNCLRREEVKDLITNVIDETYVQFAGKTFKQVCGIVMGSAASPMLADLSLTYLEYAYVLGNADIKIWGKRYIDDILVANSDNFMELANNIYPMELPLKRTNPSIDKADFLDLSLSIANGRCHTSVFDKTDSFPFKVIKYGFADSNVHRKVGLGTFYSQCLRFARISDNVTDYQRRVQSCFHDLVNHGFEITRLICKFFLFANKYRDILTKYGLCGHADVVRFANDTFV